MANTVIALKKSATPSSVPSNLANGELAINYADGKLYYKAANGTIASISGNEPNYFGTVNANNTLVVADTPGDVFTLASGNNIAITGDAINDKITIGLTNDVSLPGTLTLGAVGGDEGGELKLANALTNSVLSGKVIIDIYQNKLRFYEEAGTNRGVYIDLSAASGGVATDLLASSGSVDSTARQWATGAFGQANIAYAHANAAYDAANNAVTDFSPAFIQANTARDHANAAFASANAGQATANAAFDKANTANITADLAFIHANAAFAKANSANVLAYNTGIGANSYAEAIGAAANSIAISAFIQANAAYDAANNAVTDFSPAFIQANTARVHANASFEQANTARDHANAAFASSNSVNTYSNSTYVKLSSPNQTITGDLSVSGNLIVMGNSVAYSVENLIINDSLILLANNNGSDIVDIGFIGHYINATGQNVHTGLYREHENKEYYLFQGYDVEPTYNHLGAMSNNMTLATLNADLKTSNLILGGANAILTIGAAFAQANTARNHANAAFNAANNAVTDFSPAFLTANIAYAHANASFNKANSALPNTSGVAFNGNLNLPTGNLAVGIATPNVGAKLQVYNTTGNSELWITADNGYDPTLRLTGEAGDIVNEGFTIRYDNSVGDTYFENKFGAVTSYHFLTSVVEALTIHTDGKVGVGTTTPQYILDVKGVANVSSALLVNDMNVKPTIQTAFNKANTANITADRAWDHANAAFATVNSAFGVANTALPNTSGISFAGSLFFPTGNVGIRTLSSAAPLSIGFDNTTEPTSGGGRILQLENSNTSTSSKTSIVFYGSDAGGTLRHGASMLWGKSGPWTNGGNDYASYLAFYTRTTGSTQLERMRIDDSGNVGIGTTTVPAQLTIVGAGQAVVSNFNTANTLAGTILVGSSGTAAQDGGAIVFSAASTAWRFAAIKGHVLNGTSNTVGDITFQTRRVSTDPTLTETLRVSYTGNVLIGRTDSTVGSGVKLDVNGAVNASAILVNGSPLNPADVVARQTANAAFLHANAAFDKANTSSGAAYFTGNNGDVGNATGLGDIFRVVTKTLSANVTIYSGNNAIAAGPITIAPNGSLTIQNDSRVAIV